MKQSSTHAFLKGAPNSPWTSLPGKHQPTRPRGAYAPWEGWWENLTWQAQIGRPWWLPGTGFPNHQSSVQKAMTSTLLSGSTKATRKLVKGQLAWSLKWWPFQDCHFTSPPWPWTVAVGTTSNQPTAQIHTDLESWGEGTCLAWRGQTMSTSATVSRACATSIYPAPAVTRVWAKPRSLGAHFTPRGGGLVGPRFPSRGVPRFSPPVGSRGSPVST